MLRVRAGGALVAHPPLRVQGRGLGPRRPRGLRLCPGTSGGGLSCALVMMRRCFGAREAVDKRWTLTLCEEGGESQTTVRGAWLRR